MLMAAGQRHISQEQFKLLAMDHDRNTGRIFL
jgi:hypothetical protein